MLFECLLVLNTEEEKKQFTEIYEREQQILIKYAYSKLGNMQDAEDAVAEGFLRLAKNFQNYSKSTCSEIHNLLVIIVRNLIVDGYRSGGRSPVFIGENEDNNTAFVEEALRRFDLSDSPEKNYITRETVGRIIAAMDKLTPETKQTFIMRYYNGVTPESISAQLHVPVKTVQQRLYRAKLQIRKELEKDE